MNKGTLDLLYGQTMSYLPTRRGAIQAGMIGTGLGLAELPAMQAIAAPQISPRAKQVLFVFLTGGISHHDTFDMKPDAPEGIRGEFNPVSTSVPGLMASEHLPLLGARAHNYTLHRGMKTNSSGHEPACHMLLTGRMDLPPNFTLNNVPNAMEFPTLASQVKYAYRGQRELNLPPAAILPEPSVNEAARFRPGQYAGQMGKLWEAWHIDIAANCPLGNGACPDCFRFEGTPFEHAAKTIFTTPSLKLPEGGHKRFRGRLDFLDFIQGQQSQLEESTGGLDQHRRQAISVLTAPNVRAAFDVERSDPKVVERYGRNKFGLSLLMGKRLIAAGVPLVQVNLGKNSSWDTHRRNFPNLKENLLPPLDKGMSALLDDMAASGLLDETLVIMAGEFGRTPKINKDGGRDHWGPVNTMLFAGAGVEGGRVIGASDSNGAEIIDGMQTTENFAATIFSMLGIPRGATWMDMEGRPHQIYHGRPIEGLL